MDDDIAVSVYMRKSDEQMLRPQTTEKAVGFNRFQTFYCVLERTSFI